MEENEVTEVTFLFQFGLIRDTISVDVTTLTLRSLKQYACDFVNSKVSLNYTNF